jgi:hypothetical protein
MAGDWPFRLTPDAYGSLQFHDFPGARIDEVASHLYRTEPRFMAALEADVREHGVHQPVELGNQDTLQDGHHRIAAAYRTGQPVPVAFYGERYPKDRDEEARWGDLRAEHRAEQAARMAHRPQTWEPRQAEPEREAGQ